MKTLADITEGCDTAAVSDEDVAEALAEEFAKMYRPEEANLQLAQNHINNFLSHKTSLCLSRASLKDPATREILFAGVALFKGWKKV